MALNTHFLRYFRRKVTTLFSPDHFNDVDRRLLECLCRVVTQAMQYHHAHNSPVTSPDTWAAFMKAAMEFCALPKWSLLGPECYEASIPWREERMADAMIKEAAKLGNAMMIRSVMATFKRAELLKVDSKGETIVHLAARLGHIEVMKLCMEGLPLQAGKPLAPGYPNLPFYKRGQFGYNPLLAAVSGGQREVVAFFVERGADLNVQDGSGGNALHVALRHSQSSIIPWLCCMGVDVMHARPNGGNTPLHVALESCSDSSWDLLLEHGGPGVVEWWYPHTSALLSTPSQHQVWVLHRWIGGE